ncbi:MAG: hypothetical protein IT273_14550 [Chitinophagales bacterium]|nr:hypothetical protein [Chitinophagales bacterium]
MTGLSTYPTNLGTLSLRDLLDDDEDDDSLDDGEDTEDEDGFDFDVVE